MLRIFPKISKLLKRFILGAEKIPKFIKIKSPGEALSTFIRASRDPKGETQLRVVKSTKMGLLTPKTKPKHFPNKSKTTLKKSRNRHF